MNEAFTQEEKTFIKRKIDQGYFSLARVYGPFFMALLIAYFSTKRKGIDRHISASQYDSIYLFVFGFFVIVFLFFAVKDYRRKVSPLKKELASGSKKTISFVARKYFDPVYKRLLLYHPSREDTYLLMQEEEYSSIDEGDAMELSITSISGTLLTLRSNNKTFPNVEEFSF